MNTPRITGHSISQNTETIEVTLNVAHPQPVVFEETDDHGNTNLTYQPQTWHLYVRLTEAGFINNGGTPTTAYVVHTMVMDSPNVETEPEAGIRRHMGKQGFSYVATFDHDPTEDDINSAIDTFSHGELQGVDKDTLDRELNAADRFQDAIAEFARKAKEMGGNITDAAHDVASKVQRPTHTSHDDRLKDTIFDLD